MNVPLDPALQHQCERMVTDLCAEFAGAFDRPQIEDVMSDSVDRVLETATVFDFVPLMAYRFTRERLNAIRRARGEDTQGARDVVFVSLSGGGRGQIASGRHAARAMARLELPEHDLVGIRAANPGPFTLSGTNSWIVGRGPAWLVDPGPAFDEHLAALWGEIMRRGALGGIALTHDHPDHAEAVAAMRERYPDAPLAAARGNVDILLSDGDAFGPLEVVGTPGHAPDHLAFVTGTAALTGDAVLGEGSVFISPDPGALVAYLDGLAKLQRRRLEILCPGHGPPVHDPAAKLEEYISHRLDRERRLVEALDQGKRSVDELLDAAWSEVPPQLRPAAAVTLAAHLDKLAGDGRLPAGVERPSVRL